MAGSRQLERVGIGQWNDFTASEAKAYQDISISAVRAVADWRVVVDQIRELGRLPYAGADPLVRYEEHRLTFTGYLRHTFAGKGFLRLDWREEWLARGVTRDRLAELDGWLESVEYEHTDFCPRPGARPVRSPRLDDSQRRPGDGLERLMRTSVRFPWPDSMRCAPVPATP